MTEARDRYAAALHEALRDYGEGDHDPGTGSDYGDQTAVALAVRDDELAQVRYERDQLREALKTVTGQCRGAEGRLAELQKQQAAVNPPGPTREQLPADILALLTHRTYLSTACETARLLDGAIIRNPDRADLPGWRDRMHQRCRLNHKFTGKPCSCHCHQGE